MILGPVAEPVDSQCPVAELVEAPGSSIPHSGLDPESLKTFCREIAILRIQPRQMPLYKPVSAASQATRGRFRARPFWSREATWPMQYRHTLPFPASPKHELPSGAGLPPLPFHNPVESGNRLALQSVL